MRISLKPFNPSICCYLSRYLSVLHYHDNGHSNNHCEIVVNSMVMNGRCHLAIAVTLVVLCTMMISVNAYTTNFTCPSITLQSKTLAAAGSLPVYVRPDRLAFAAHNQLLPYPIYDMLIMCTHMCGDDVVMIIAWSWSISIMSRICRWLCIMLWFYRCYQRIQNSWLTILSWCCTIYEHATTMLAIRSTIGIVIITSTHMHLACSHLL